MLAAVLAATIPILALAKSKATAAAAVAVVVESIMMFRENVFFDNFDKNTFVFAPTIELLEFLDKREGSTSAVR
jgi:hypothetical protein